MGQTPCCDMMGIRKGPWSLEEDRKLIDYIQKHGFGNWRAIPMQAGIMRCGKSCRLRWMNYLRPDLKRGNLSPDEMETIIRLHGILGNKWSTIASHLPGRTDNEIKNLWYSHLKKHSDCGRKKPVRHRPAHSPTFSTSKDSAEHIKLSGTEYSAGKDIIDDQQFVSNNLSETYQRDENLSAPDYINFLKKFLDIDEEPSVICPSYELNQDSHHFNNEERNVQQQKCLSLDQGSEDHTTPAVFCWNSPFSANQLDHEIQASFAVDSQVSYSYSPNCSSSNTLHADTSMSLFPDSLLDLPENMWWAF